MKKRSAAFFLIFIMIFLACSEKSSQSASDYSESLIILKKATDINYAKLKGSDQVSYHIIAKYPAEDAISELNYRLKALGWKALEKDWLNPEIPTSHMRGWTDFIDGTTNPNRKVHSWHSDWKNDNEDMLIFVLRYSYPLKADPNMTELTVFGTYIPEKLAKQTLKHVNEYRKSMEKNL